ncbi:hypothetical protein GCM10010260_68480 [Streptomyces filipinensis]|uniref:Uncharacterized protein n=1 Tax=Streptomyces filipinensis TaxID=66887 RepID=A0A918ME51_9ACTN|nr:hypothetical protein GCM10010260_68480 [Streptomyces filipinensis]
MPGSAPPVCPVEAEHHRGGDVDADPAKGAPQILRRAATGTAKGAPQNHGRKPQVPRKPPRLPRPGHHRLPGRARRGRDPAGAAKGPAEAPVGTTPQSREERVTDARGRGTAGPRGGAAG